MKHLNKKFIVSLSLTFITFFNPAISYGLKKKDANGQTVSVQVPPTQLSPQMAQTQAHYEIPAAIKQQNDQSFAMVVPGLEERPNEVRDLMTQMQIVLVIDRSGSQVTNDIHPADKAQYMQFSQREGMLTYNGRRYWSQWDNTLVAAKYLSESMFKYDKDGEIPVIFFDHKIEEVLVHNPNELMNAFNNRLPNNGTTNLFSALEYGFKKYIDMQHTLFIVITDGQPDSGQESRIEELIYNKLTLNDPQGDRFNVLFLRIGDDPGAKAFLQRMDDSDYIGKNVDTKEDDALYKHGPDNLILNAITEHLDSTLYLQ